VLCERLRRGGAEAEGGGTEAEGAAGAERKTRTPHSDVGKKHRYAKVANIQGLRCHTVIPIPILIQETMPFCRCQGVQKTCCLYKADCQSVCSTC